jgi:hypothetical protein
MAAGGRCQDLLQISMLDQLDTRTGSWNVFVRQSRNGGRTFGPTKQVSSYVPRLSISDAGGILIAVR